MLGGLRVFGRAEGVKEEGGGDTNSSILVADGSRTSTEVRPETSSLEA
jgi:hypothetical protein